MDPTAQPPGAAAPPDAVPADAVPANGVPAEAVRVGSPQCPCGAVAPANLPPEGGVPVPCAACRTPLVGTHEPDDWTVERGFAAALVAGVVLAGLRLLAGRSTWSGAAWTVPLGAAGVAWSTRIAARVRTPGLQWCAFGGFAAFLALGETLLYRFALRGRLIAMHAAEGATEPDRLGDEEWRAMDFEKFLHIEVDFSWFVAVGLALWLLARATRPPDAVVVYTPAPGGGPTTGTAERPPADPAADPAVDSAAR